MASKTYSLTSIVKNIVDVTLL